VVIGCGLVSWVVVKLFKFFIIHFVFNPGIVLLPKKNVYGEWPASGQFVVVESRGNRNLTKDGENIGVAQVRSTVVVGVNAQTNIISPLFETRGKNFHREFHRYQMEWTPGKNKTAES
jgi:hypothetical protein